MLPKNMSLRKPQKEQFVGLKITEGQHLSNIQKLMI